MYGLQESLSMDELNHYSHYRPPLTEFPVSCDAVCGLLGSAVMMMDLLSAGQGDGDAQDQYGVLCLPYPQQRCVSRFVFFSVSVYISLSVSP
jgi:hypothetical protein